MKKTSLIGHTVEVYGLILHDKYPADSIIDDFFRSHKYLGSHDRKFIAEAVYGMLRHRSRVEWLLDATKMQPPASFSGSRSFLLCLVYLIVAGSEIPATLVEEIEADPAVASFLHSILTKVKSLDERFDEHTSSFETNLRLSIKFSFPLWMIESWLERYGLDETTKLCEALNTPAPLTLRVNTIKTTLENCIEALAVDDIVTTKTKYSPVGLAVAKRMNIFQRDAFRNGFFEVQDEGSQLLAFLVDPKPRSKVVDACAGGGGKSLALAALMNNHGVVHALDTNAHRLEELRKRIRRSGVDTIRIRPVKEGELPSELIGTADNVLVDSPCSGLGTIRRNPGMKWTVTPASIKELTAKQSTILDHYAQCVKPNGRLIYATCTTLRSENEDIVERFLAAHPEFELMEPSVILKRYGLESIAKEKYFQLLPHIHGTDGFFAAVMKRKP